MFRVRQLGNYDAVAEIQSERSVDSYGIDRLLLHWNVSNRYELINWQYSGAACHSTDNFRCSNVQSYVIRVIRSRSATKILNIESLQKCYNDLLKYRKYLHQQNGSVNSAVTYPAISASDK